MIATLVQIAQEMARYEAKLKCMEVEKVILNRICESPIKRAIPKVVIWDVINKRVRIEDYKDEERYRYLYALSTGKHAVGPSWLIESKRGKSLDKLIQTAVKEIQSALTGLAKSLEDPDEQKYVERCCKILEKQSEQVVKELKAKAHDCLPILLTIDYEGKLPGEMTELQKAFVHKRVVGERRAKSKGKGDCAICGKEAIVQSAIPFPFFTVEKQGFSPMGREEMVWKYAPICYECAKWSCVARSYLQENLRTRVAGKAVYLLPDLEPGATEIGGPFIHYLWEWHKRMEGKIVPDEGFPIEERRESTLPNLFEGLVEDYDKQFKEKPPFRSASLVFHQPGQKFLFLYTISGILPCNLQKVSSCLRKLRELLNKGMLGDDGKVLSKRLKADLEFVGQAWRWMRIGETEVQGALKLSPMHLAEAILTNKCPPEDIFWSDVDKLLKATYLEWVKSTQQQPLYKVLAEQAGRIWVIWALIYRRKEVIELVTQPVISDEKPTPQSVSSEFWEEFFQPMLVLDSESKKAVFLIGVLFGEVERLQRQERDSKTGEMPIVSRLRGLTISGDEITERLLPELMHKVRQLGGNTKAAMSIQQAAAYYATRGDKIPDKEARYCFCLGWALSQLVIQKVEEKEDGEEALE